MSIAEGIKTRRLRKSAVLGAPPPAMPPIERGRPAVQKGVTAAQQNMQSGPKATPEFTDREMSRPAASEIRQPSNHLDTLYEQAAAHKEHLDNLIDKGQGVGDKLGMHIVHGHPSEHDIAEGHRKGGLVVMAPLKGRDRAEEKVAKDYGGDTSQIKDLSRATIAVRHADDIPHVMHRLRQHGMQMKSAPKFKRTNAGYQDITVHPVHSETGHIGEMQMMPLDMLHAKSHGLPEHGFPTAGHRLYEDQRILEAKENRTVDEQRQLKKLDAESNGLYGTANGLHDTRIPAFAQRLVKGLYDAIVKAVQIRGAMRRGKMFHKESGHTHSNWRDGGWYHPADHGHFVHNASQISEHEFHQLCRKVGAHQP